MIRIVATSLLFLAPPGLAQDVSGSPRAVDGDSLDFGGIAVRLYGIDAPELSQECQKDGATWSCGKQAAGKLSALVAGRQTSCEQKDVDPHGRTVATCRAGGVDLAGAMIEAGLAVALPDFTHLYVASEARARAARNGLWGGTFQMPAEYRAAHPRDDRQGARPNPAAAAAPRVAPANTYFRNCREAWAAGAAPLYRGQPSYRPEMDGDGDGIACEPYRRR